MDPARIVVLAGGVGGAKFVRGLRALVRRTASPAAITVVANTGDDLWLAGLRVTPDLDSLMYALAGVNDDVRGWGRAGESERVSAELAAYGVGWPWFTLGDLDIGTHIARTALLREGLPLSAVVERLSARWPLGVRLLPATDAEVETHVVTAEGELHFEEWWVRTRAALPALGFVQRGVESATAAPGVREAIAAADVVLLAPSNPVVSIGTILGIPGIREALRDTAAPVVGLSPVIGGSVVRGMADACLTAIGVETDAAAIARHYGARSAGGLLDGWLVDETDAAAVDPLRAAGIAARAVPLWMTDDDATAAMADAALRLARR
ncbi:2-phospho-L-lactate transferase [Amnibacterium kyonggiense]|uniref:LPPG:FO 2-phospho-L-lactate transferase n=1 Tax=Amnibacterium kyonggiense TaxID=595671 RepID=A0A4R7FSX5_9MICO|nr:2-phospho-L-lactate transferase [Amnibacterium kyonggiense]TDS80906.1 LPPG:FO 2-phospho-L-lactate transferase [Amnibacterium kyonggiense]